MITLPLDKMTRNDKLVAMEMLWDDLTHSNEEIESPAWHEDVLNERAKELADSTDSFLDWEDVKKEI